MESAGAGGESERRQNLARAVNQSTVDRWDDYSDHRQRLSDLIDRPRPHFAGPLHVAIMGPDNCNDLDLRRLANRFSGIHLFDIDSDAVRASVHRQSPGGKIQVHAVDLMCDDALSAAIAPLAGQNQIVVSATVLSQLVDNLIVERPNATVQDVHRLRRQHMRAMLDLAGDDGRLLLINDLASSETVSGLGCVPEPVLIRAAEALIQEGNFFTGSNPWSICDQLQMDLLLQDAADVILDNFWLWKMSDTVSRMVYAIGWRRARRASVTRPTS